MLSLIPAACAAVLCTGSPESALPAASMPVFEATAVAALAFCAPNRSVGSAAPKRTGPLGWLLRYNRDEDELERTRVAAPISYYLRSPLLTSFFAGVPCPQPGDKAAADAESCASLLVRRRDRDELLEVRLPQYGATTAGRLRSVVSDHQTRGDALQFTVNGDDEIEVPANAIREVQARVCR